MKKTLLFLFPIFLIGIVIGSGFLLSSKKTLTHNSKAEIPSGELSKRGSIVVMSFNVHGIALCNGHQSAVAEYLIDNKVDVLVLQENDCPVSDFARVWQNKLQAIIPTERVSYTYKTRQVAILTRLMVENTLVRPGDVNNLQIPLEFDDGNFIYEYRDDSWTQGRSLAKRFIRSAILNISGSRVRIIGIHPTNYDGCGQVNTKVNEYVSTLTDAPIIIAGDFNCSARSFYKHPTMQLLQNYKVTCFSPEKPGNFPYIAECGPSTHGIGTYTPWSLEDEGDPLKAQGPIDHVAVMQATIRGVKLDGPKNELIVRERSLSFSDHYPIKADIDVYSNSPPLTPWPMKTTSPSAALPPPPFSTPTATPSPTILSLPITIELKLKLQGISKKPSGGDTMRIWIKLVGIDPSQTIPFAPTTFTINDSGVWTGSFSVVSLAPGAGYTLFIKGPNHLAKKVCNINPVEEQGGSYSCKVGQTIFLSPGTNILDFSNITLMAGDLPEVSGSQNGIVDAYDTTYVRTNLGSSDPSKLTVGDLNMDGIIDTQDYSMILQSLPIKFDEE